MLQSAGIGSDSYGQTLLGRIDARLFSNPHARSVLLITLLAALIAPTVLVSRKITQTDVSLWRGERGRSALGRFLPDAQALCRGEDPYGEGHWFPTPPLNLLAIVPLTYVPAWAAAALWSTAKIALALAGMALVARVAGPHGRPLPVGVLVITALFSFRPIISDITHGNLNLFLLGELALFWWFFARGRDLSAGLMLALAVTTKVTPLLLVVYIIYKRAWRVLVGVAVGLLLFIVIIPGLLLGFGRNASLLHSWFDMLVAPYALHGYVSYEIANQSLPGCLLRLGRHAGFIATQEIPSDLAAVTGMEYMARATSTAGQLYMRSGALLVVAALAWLCRASAVPRQATLNTFPDHRAVRTDPRLMLEFALVLLAMLLLSERTWKHHATTLPLVYLAVWRVLTCEPGSDRFRRWFVAGLVLQWLLLMGSGLGGERLDDLMLYNGAFCAGLALCFTQSALLLRRLPPPPTPWATQPDPA